MGYGIDARCCHCVGRFVTWRMLAEDNDAVLMPVLSSETEANMIANLRDGRVDLRCGAACAETWRANLLTLNNRYVAKDWLHLGALVMQIGYQNDLAYYYLGQSAQGLGSPKAALKFYRISGALASRNDPQFKCNSGGPRLLQRYQSSARSLSCYADCSET